jgi:hypothetical protein
MSAMMMAKPIEDSLCIALLLVQKDPCRMTEELPGE